ncbi:MAG: UDP-N-acetylglucosamine pyrophosphorylase [Clostridia bacterium]|nr:UDP-N-acetylglucosamine pyrophosphorylase [Clostridia bacterium]
MLTIKDLYDLSHTRAADLLNRHRYPWEALAEIKELILALGAALPGDEFEEVSEHVWIARDAVVYPNNYIAGPCIIGHETEVRPGAFVRGSALVGDGCVVGNSTELKNVILFDRVQVPHYNYVGDSILGYRSHMGAGSITSNVRSDKKLITVHCGTESVETGLKKIGAMLGDRVEVGCNSVLNPGTVVGRDSQIYPTSCVRGTVPARSIWKNNGMVVPKND